VAHGSRRERLVLALRLPCHRRGAELHELRIAQAVVEGHRAQFKRGAGYLFAQGNVTQQTSNQHSWGTKLVSTMYPPQQPAGVLAQAAAMRQS
jgi:hypothetical protein